ncbi:MAG: cell division control protein Cdc6, partial [Candidatus Thermoplasmatota archaeon]|nr:cell division control protein Cdc6 [Candidatus Thermoplasmatota archaeon]
TSFADNLDARVRSRLNQESIIFQPYNATQLRDILKDRMGGIVSHTVVEDSALNLCAAIGAREHGDARKAIDLLRISMEIAIREGKSRVGEAEVYKARDKFETDVIKESIMALPLHSKIILLSVVLSQKFANRPAYTGEVYENYKRICEEISVQNLGFRRISEILSDLDDIGLIVSVTKSMGRGGRTRFIRVPDHIDSIEQHILEDEQLSTFKGVKLTKQEKLSGLEDESHQDIDDIFNSQRSD